MSSVGGKKSIPDDLLTRNVVDIIVRDELEKKLSSGKKLNIKLGFDPTGAQLHIGRAVTLWKLRAFQDLGHNIQFVIGNFTGTIGDSSDKDSERPMLDRKTVEQNAKDYHRQLEKILDMKKVKIFYNGDWFDNMPLSQFFELTQHFTIQQMTERDNFSNRIKAGKPVGLHETLYPLLQGYDSVAMKTDLEVGGTDQLFNLLAGRTVQKHFGLEPQSVMTFELLEGLDGRKMSTSWGNCIYIMDEPVEMYGKVMTLRDELIPRYFRLCTDVEIGVIEQIEQNLAAGDNPRDTKASLARAIVARYHGGEIADRAEETWNKRFRDGEKPEHIEEVYIKKADSHNLVDFVSENFNISKSEARRIINQNGLKIDDEITTESALELRDGMVVQVGKHRFKRITTQK